MPRSLVPSGSTPSYSSRFPRPSQNGRSTDRASNSYHSSVPESGFRSFRLWIRQVPCRKSKSWAPSRGASAAVIEDVLTGIGDWDWVVDSGREATAARAIPRTRRWLMAPD